MNQAELRLMATERILDADALIAAGRWAFAYYVAGYAVECALKSSVLARMIVTGAVFEEKKSAPNYRTHDFGDLIVAAGLKAELDARLAHSAAVGDAFVTNWGVVTQWNETSRYEAKTQLESASLYGAITNNPDGVLLWIQNYW
jgi:hypothetical protein